MIKVLLAEDHNIVRNGIRSLLDKQADINVIGEATDGLEVLQLLEQGLRPDLVLTDINMPNLNGMALIEELKKKSPDLKVLILSMLDHENYVLQAVKIGAAGFLLKNVSEEEMVFAIRHVMAGSMYVCSELTAKLIAKLNNLPQSDNKEIKVAIDLSRREIEILLLIAEGLTNNEIAEKLFTSRRTVEGHRQNLLEKTGARNTATLIRFAVRNGIID
ncbi:response regulator transcription factor [Pedobacter sp. P351]|uniref:response regulator transcription factor n=1 Tax=Pedobacter superstes TaxID=3133441 RepID=UPI0030B25FFB